MGTGPVGGPEPTGCYLRRIASTQCFCPATPRFNRGSRRIWTDSARLGHRLVPGRWTRYAADDAPRCCKSWFARSCADSRSLPGDASASAPGTASTHADPAEARHTVLPFPASVQQESTSNPRPRPLITAPVQRAAALQCSRCGVGDLARSFLYHPYHRMLGLRPCHTTRCSEAQRAPLQLVPVQLHTNSVRCAEADSLLPRCANFKRHLHFPSDVLPSRHPLACTKCVDTNQLLAYNPSLISRYMQQKK